MLEKNLNELDLSAARSEHTPTKKLSYTVRVIALCNVAFLLCVLFSLAILYRLGSITFRIPLGSYLIAPGEWFLQYRSLTGFTTNVLFLFITGLEFGIYVVCALVIRRQTNPQENIQSLYIILLGALVAGLLFVFTPALLSGDIFSYGSYGRILVTYHANPYFVPPSTFPHDALASRNGWPDVISVYGPSWLVVCTMVALVAGTSSLRYILLFRLVGLTVHIINTLLVAATLRTMGRTWRIATLGVLLYAWNPLALLESSLNGHNDAFMATFMLLGILLCVRGEQSQFKRPGNYLLPIVAFSVATLVKVIAAPCIVFLLVFLARTQLASRLSTSPGEKVKLANSWRPVLLKVLVAGCASVLIILILYLPFWIGHSIQDIIHTFTSPPAARGAEHSIMRAVDEWIIAYGLPAQPSWANTSLNILSPRSTWNTINFAILAIGLLIGSIWLWRKPTTRTLILATLATLGAILFVIPWFFPWYVSPLVCLAALCLPISANRVERALFAFALTFSATARLTYLLLGYPQVGNWYTFNCLAALGPPLLVFVVFLAVGWRKEKQPSIQSTQ